MLPGDHRLPQQKSVSASLEERRRTEREEGPSQSIEGNERR